MTEKLFEVDAIAMAPVVENGKKRWVIHGKSGGQAYKVIVNIGDRQERYIELDTVAPCA